MNFKVMPNSVSADSDYRLSAEQLQFYDQNGYVVVRQMFSKETLEAYRQRFLDVCRGKLGRDQVSVLKDRALCTPGAKPEEYINKVQELLYDEVFSTYSEDPRLLAAVSQLVGPDIAAASLMLINKPPGTIAHPPHQDLLYMPLRPAEKIVGAWTAIDPACRANGTLYMVPGSHAANLLLQHSDQVQDAKDLFHGLVNWEAIAPESRRVYLDMQPGDTLLFHSCVVHGSLPNNSNLYRKSIVCHFLSARCHLVDATGTRHDTIAKQVEEQIRRYGSPLSFTDFWRIKQKHVKGTRCNL